MKTLMTYWLVGFIMVGLFAGYAHKRCPVDDVDMKNLTLLAATWPLSIAAIVGMIYTKNDNFDRPHPTKCKVESDRNYDVIVKGD